MKGRLLAAVPMYGGIHPCADAPRLNMLLTTQRTHKYLEVEAFDTYRELIFRAREKILALARRDKFDFLYFQDEDIVVKQDTLNRLLRWDKPAVGALYYGRQPLHSPFLFEQIGTGPHFKTMGFMPGKVLAKVDGTGLGCCLIKREVLEAVPRNAFTAFGEVIDDRAFWFFVKEAGFQLWIDMSTEVGHISYDPVVINGESRDQAVIEARKKGTWKKPSRGLRINRDKLEGERCQNRT